MKTFALSLNLIFLANFLFAQRSFIKELSPLDSVYYEFVQVTDDGGWIAAGGNFVSKFSPCGDIEWSNQYLLDGRIAASTVITMDSSNNILIYGDIDIDPSSQTEKTRFLMKLDEMGNVLWCKQFQPNIGVNSPSFYRRKIEIAPDGSYFLFGDIFYSFNQLSDYFIMKLDSDGNVIWSNVYNYYASVYTKISSTSDGGLMVFGNKSGDPQVHRHILKLDANGIIEWQKGIGGVSTADMIETDDGYLCVGSVNKSETDTIPSTTGPIITTLISQFNCFSYKLDFEGNLLWTGEILHEPRCFRCDIESLKNGNFYISGRNGYSTPMAFRTEISPNGNVIEQRTYRDAFFLNAMDLFKDNTVLFSNGNSLLKTDALKLLACEDSISFPLNQVVEIESVPISFGTSYELEVIFLDLQVYTSEKLISLEDVCEEYYQFDTQVDTSICTGEQLEFDVDFYGAESFRWQDGSSESFIKITKPGIYEVEIENCNNIITKSFNVIDRGCDCANFPNVFTPDGDGNNDFFQPIYGCEVKNTIFKIYNRWGEIVFSSNDKEARWNGTFRGKSATTDVYVYFFSYENEQGEPILEKGDVTLLR